MRTPLIPFATVWSTEKLALSTVAENLSVPQLASRVAVPISTSEGELVRDGTWPEAGAESNGKT